MKYILNLIIVFSVSITFAQTHPLVITSEIGHCQLIIDDSIKITVPKTIQLSEGIHKFQFKHDSLNYISIYNIKKLEHFRINKELSSYLEINNIKSDFEFADLPNQIYVYTRNKIDTIDFEVKRNTIKINPTDSILHIFAPGYCQYEDTLLIKPFIIYDIEPKLIETDSLKYDLIMKEESRRKIHKKIAILGLSLSNVLFIYQYLNPDDMSDQYYKDYLSEIDTDYISKKYQIYKKEIDRVNRHKNVYLSAAIVNGVLLTYAILFENYTDLSENKNKIQSAFSMRSLIINNQLAINLSIRF